MWTTHNTVVAIAGAVAIVAAAVIGRLDYLRLCDNLNSEEAAELGRDLKEPTVLGFVRIVDGVMMPFGADNPRNGDVAILIEGGGIGWRVAIGHEKVYRMNLTKPDEVMHTCKLTKYHIEVLRPIVDDWI